MNPPSASLNVLRRIAMLCALLVLLIAGVSAFLRLSKAGLGCEPWPSCFGEALRALQRGAAVDDNAVQTVALARLAHRLLASTALVLALLLALGHCTAKPLHKGRAALALGLVATALFLAGLGLLTANSRLPAVALGNLLGGFAMLAVSWRLAAPERPSDAAPRAAALWALVACGLVVIQVALGGLVSASHASLSCADSLDCLRQAARQGWPWPTLNPWREPAYDVASALPINPAGALAQALHRVGAIVASLAVLVVAWLLHRQAERRAAATLVLLLSLQLAAGLWLVSGGVPLAGALLHNLLAALMVAALARSI